MTLSPAREITQDEVRQYESDGIVCLRQMFDTSTVAMLRDVVDRDMAQPGPMAVDATRDGEGQFFGDTFVWKQFGELARFVFDSPAADIAAALLRSRKVNLLFDQFLVKAPGTTTPTLWHHDAPYWPVAGQQVCTLWLALDPVRKESGAVEYVAGSHLWGQRYKAVSFKDEDLYKEDLPPVPDIDAMRDELEFAQFEMEPGDCTIHHGLTVHGAPGNATGGRRRAFVTRWAGDDAVYHPRPNIMPQLAEPDLPAGAPITCDLWPQIWPAPAP